jgi:hypothetical protein
VERVSRFEDFEAHLPVGRLLIGRHTYSHIVHAASEAATVAALRVLRSEAKNSSPGIPAPGRPDSDRNESGTGLLKPFEGMCPYVLMFGVIMTILQPHARRRGLDVLTMINSWMYVVSPAVMVATDVA